MLWERAQAGGLSPADYVATLTALTAESIALSCRVELSRAGGRGDFVSGGEGTQPRSDGDADTGSSTGPGVDIR